MFQFMYSEVDYMFGSNFLKQDLSFEHKIYELRWKHSQANGLGDNRKQRQR